MKSALEFAFVIAENGLIETDQLPPKIAEPGRVSSHGADLFESAVSRIELIHSAAPPEKTALIEALKKTGGNQSQAARILGINRVTVWNRMKKYGVDLKRVLAT